jgi:hypothetical protein
MSSSRPPYTLPLLTPAVRRGEADGGSIGAVLWARRLPTRSVLYFCFRSMYKPPCSPVAGRRVCFEQPWWPHCRRASLLACVAFTSIVSVPLVVHGFAAVHGRAVVPGHGELPSSAVDRSRGHRTLVHR